MADMRVLVTGATGFVGLKIVAALRAAGHQVIGLTRSAAGAETLRATGVEAVGGTLQDLAGLHTAASMADAVIHTAFDAGIDRYEASCEQDRRAIKALAEGLNRAGPLIITSCTALGDYAPGVLASEAVFNSAQGHPRKASELAAGALLQQGHDVRIVRLPLVHNAETQSRLDGYVQWAQRVGVAAFVGDGSNRWAAVHVDDVARLYALVLSKGVSGHRYNAVAEEGVQARDAIEVIARGLGIPTRSISDRTAADLFDWPAMFAGSNLPASSTITRVRLDWQPTGPTLLEDLKARRYARNTEAA